MKGEKQYWLVTYVATNRQTGANHHTTTVIDKTICEFVEGMSMYNFGERQDKFYSNYAIVYSHQITKKEFEKYDGHFS